MTKLTGIQPAKHPNTLRLQGATLQRLLDELDAVASRQTAEEVKRDFRRWTIRAMSEVRVDMHQPGGTVTSLRYVCRDLSGSGVGVLHSAYVHPGTRCVVHVGQEGRRATLVPGVVQRCRLMGRGIHEVGIKFRTPITVRNFVDLDPLQGKFSLERIDPSSLKGGVLHVDDSSIERKLIRHLLEETQLGIVSAESADEGRTRAAENFDLVIATTHLKCSDGQDLCRALRADGVQAPIVLTSTDQTDSAAEEAREAGASALLRKPFGRELLLAAVAEFLLLTPPSMDGSGPIYSTIKPEDPLFKFVPEFIGELQDTAKRLSEALTKQEIELIRTECFQVMGASSSLGLEPVGRIAGEALRQVTASMSAIESEKAIKDLIMACRRVREREAA
ncbi:MAG: response regulator [Phycisphaerales bacterium]